MSHAPLNKALDARRLVVKMDATIYGERLALICGELQKIANAEIRGDGVASFIYAWSSRGAVELSESNEGIWVEFWRFGIEQRDREETFQTYNLACEAIAKWLA